MNLFNKLPIRIALAAALIAPAYLASPLVRTVAAADDKVKKGELHEHMEAMDGAMKKLRRSLKDAAQKDESLKQIEAFVKAAKACRDMTPSEAAKKPEADRAKYVEEYKKQMDAVIAEMGKMETAVKAGNAEEAQKIHAGLKKLEEKGHDAYMPDEGKK
jgi:soluble cytochrome b562